MKIDSQLECLHWLLLNASVEPASIEPLHCIIPAEKLVNLDTIKRGWDESSALLTKEGQAISRFFIIGFPDDYLSGFGCEVVSIKN